MKMNRTNTAGRILALLLTALMVLSLAACGTKGGDKMDGMSSEPKNAEEAVAMHKELMAQENAILSEDTALWEKVFMAADKGMTMQEDDKNYGEFLLDTIEGSKDQFTEDELKLLKEAAEKIREIENKLTMIEKKYPEAAQQSTDGAMSVPAGSDMTTPPDDGSMQKFPAFEGKDLDGNAVKSDELFSGNAVTVVNFWFTTCNPCVGELSELDALNKELAKKGGSLIGVNTFTLDGDEAAISEAKDVLAKKGATYQNVYFDSDGEAGKFTTNILAYPTTYVVDRSGNIVGDPIVGAITEKKQAETLQKLIDQTLAADMGWQTNLSWALTWTTPANLICLNVIPLCTHRMALWLCGAFSSAVSPSCKRPRYVLPVPGSAPSPCGVPALPAGPWRWR